MKSDHLPEKCELQKWQNHINELNYKINLYSFNINTYNICVLMISFISKNILWILSEITLKDMRKFYRKEEENCPATGEGSGDEWGRWFVQQHLNRGILLIHTFEHSSLCPARPPGLPHHQLLLGINSWTAYQELKAVHHSHAHRGWLYGGNGNRSKR